MKMRSVISILLAIVMTIGMMTIMVSAEESDVTQPTISGTTITVATVGELKWISAYSYKENESDKIENVPFNFAGYTVKITQDILNVGAFKPIKDFRGIMEGSVEGKDYATISDLTINESNGGAGLCAKSGGGSFKNICVADSTIHTSVNYAGAIAGNGFTSSFTGCHARNVTVSGRRFVGGIVGSAYGRISGCTVTADEDKTTTIKSNVTSSLLSDPINGDNVGGIVGLMGEGGMKVEMCDVKRANISGVRQVGGIVGLENYGNSVLNCTVTDTTISSGGVSFSAQPSGHVTPAVGGIVGQYGKATSTQPITTSNNTVTNVTITQAYTRGTYIGWAVGDATTYGSALANLICSNNSHSNVTGKRGSTVITLDEVGYSTPNPSN